MNEQDFLKLLAPIFADDQMIDTRISIRDFWFMDSILALAWRHPELSLHQKNWIMHLHLQIIQPILAKYPEAKPLIETGWDTTMDVPLDREQTERINDQFVNLAKEYRRRNEQE